MPNPPKNPRRTTANIEHEGPTIFYFPNPDFVGFTKTLGTRYHGERQQRALHRLLDKNRDRIKNVSDLNAFLKKVVEEGGPPMDIPQDASPLERAQEVIWTAWDTRNARSRSKLIKQALEISNDCADAYVILGHEQYLKGHFKEALEHYNRGMEAGAKAVSPEGIRTELRPLEFMCDGERIEDPWGILELRPYLRALFGRAMAVRELGRTSEAIRDLKEILRLNPKDNQSARSLLLEIYLENWMADEAMELINTYDKDSSADMVYGRLLLGFRRAGADPRLGELAKNLMKVNLYVPFVLASIKDGRKKAPDYYVAGEDSEAVCYAARAIKAWEMTPGALEWLLGLWNKHMAALMLQEKRDS